MQLTKTDSIAKKRQFSDARPCNTTDAPLVLQACLAAAFNEPALAMKKRDFLIASLASLAAPLWAQDKWGESKGYPTGWGPDGQRQMWEGYPEYHVGNFSGGIESMFAHQTIRASGQPTPWTQAKRQVKANFWMDATDFAAKFNRPALLIARQDEIWHEEYRFKRTADMRFFGWSMTKSILGVLVGIALDQKKIASLDDRLDHYLPQLKGHAFGDIRLRHVLNMSSGINICESFCAPNNGFERYGYSQIGYSPNRGKNTDQILGILKFSWGRNAAPGEQFNYTDVNPVLMAWVLETVYQMRLPAIAEKYLWQPLGAASDATWLTDAQGFTFSGAGFSATLQDWARFAMMVANEGRFNGTQIVSAAWIEETSHHGEKDQASRFNVARPGRGYRNFFWHHSADGRILRMAGAHGQNALIDKQTKTVLVQTGVGPESGADEAMSALFEAACRA
jgi:CubicO group peptidase (beta-lactamase class C family)